MKHLAHTAAYVLIILILLGTALMVALPTAAQTAGEFVPLEPSLKDVLAYDSNTLSGFFSGAFRIGIGVAGLLAVIMIMIGGFQYLTSDIPGQKSDGKDKIKGAIYGLLLILLSVVILNVINPDINDFRLLKSFTPPDQTQPPDQEPPIPPIPEPELPPQPRFCFQPLGTTGELFDRPLACFFTLAKCEESRSTFPPADGPCDDITAPAQTPPSNQTPPSKFCYDSLFVTERCFDTAAECNDDRTIVIDSSCKEVPGG